MSKPSEKETAQHTSLVSPFHYYPSAVPDLLPYIVSHWHNEFELNYVRSGFGEFYCNGTRYCAREGDIFIFSPNQTHSMTASESVSVVYDTLLFNTKVFGGMMERGNYAVITPLVNGTSNIVQPISGDCNGYGEIREITETIFSAVKQDNAVADMLVKSELIRLFHSLYTRGLIHTVERKFAVDDVRIRPILAYIEQNFAKDIKVEELADLIPLSKSYVMACFKQITGTSIVTYINQVRIRNACDMLLNSDKQVVQIAMDCGFDNLSNFNHQFKKHASCSPSAYRKKYKGCAEQQVADEV